MSALGDGGLDLALDLGVAQLGLGLALELRVGQLDADDRRQALADVVAREVGVVVLEDRVLARVVVERARQRGAEAGDVGAAVDRVDVVGEGEDALAVAVVVLERDFDLASCRRAARRRSAADGARRGRLLRWRTKLTRPPSK